MTANVSCQSSAISCHQCRLASLCLPPSLNQQELSEVDFLIQQRPILDKDQILYRLNDAFGAIYAVRSGCVKTTILTEEGDEKITGRPLHNSCLLPPNKNFQFFEKTQSKKHHFSFFRVALAAFLGCFHVLGVALL